MRIRLQSVLVASVVGFGLLAGQPTNAFAQKNGGGGYHGGGYGSGYGGNHGGYGGYGNGISIGGNNWGVTFGSPGYGNHGYGNNGYGHSGYGYSGYGNGSPYGYSYSQPYYSNYSYATPAYTYAQPAYSYASPSYQSGYYSPEQSQQYSSQQPTGPVTEVVITDTNFSPQQLNLKVGTSVRFTNNGQHMHGLSQPHHNWKSQNLSKGQTYTWTFNEPGTYDLQCSTHPEMKMTVVVQ